MTFRKMQINVRMRRGQPRMWHALPQSHRLAGAFLGPSKMRDCRTLVLSSRSLVKNLSRRLLTNFVQLVALIQRFVSELLRKWVCTVSYLCTWALRDYSGFMYVLRSRYN